MVLWERTLQKEVEIKGKHVPSAIQRPVTAGLGRAFWDDHEQILADRECKMTYGLFTCPFFYKGDKILGLTTGRDDPIQPFDDRVQSMDLETERRLHLIIQINNAVPGIFAE